MSEKKRRGAKGKIHALEKQLDALSKMLAEHEKASAVMREQLVATEAGLRGAMEALKLEASERELVLEERMRGAQRRHAEEVAGLRAHAADLTAQLKAAREESMTQSILASVALEEKDEAEAVVRESEDRERELEEEVLRVEAVLREEAAEVLSAKLLQVSVEELVAKAAAGFTEALHEKDRVIEALEEKLARRRRKHHRHHRPDGDGHHQGDDAYLQHGGHEQYVRGSREPSLNISEDWELMEADRKDTRL